MHSFIFCIQSTSNRDFSFHRFLASFMRSKSSLSIVQYVSSDIWDAEHEDSGDHVLCEYVIIFSTESRASRLCINVNEGLVVFPTKPAMRFFEMPRSFPAAINFFLATCFESWLHCGLLATPRRPAAWSRRILNQRWFFTLEVACNYLI